MTPPLAAPDRQATWAPTWVLECAEFPHVYAIRDLSVPGVGGAPFIAGDSEAGGPDLLGGGSGPDALHAWGRIIGAPTVTRRISDPLWPMVEIQDVTVTIADPDGDLTGDFRAAPFTLSRYDAFSGLRLFEWTGLIDHTSRDRDAVTLTGTSVDAAWLEERVPDGTIDAVTYPYADPSALEQVFPWVFGNVRNMTLPNIADNQVDSQFDYGLSSGSVAALLALRRLARDPVTTPSFDIAFDELEPYPGQDGVLENGTMEDWDAGAAVAPTGWTLVGAGATVAKTTTAGQVDEGAASASLTRVGTNCRLEQDVMANAPTLGLPWWRGREISVTVRARASVGATVSLRISDGVGLYDSAFHTGSGLFEDLTVGTVAVPCILDAAATTCTVRLLISTTNQTAQFDHVRVFLRAKSWEEIPRPDLYADATAVRFFLRQEDASGALYPIVADLNGLQPERNPVRAARTLLSDPTRGAGRTVDAASFDAAEIAACLTFEDAINLDAPEVFLPFRDTFDSGAAQTRTVRDRSGHERHGVYDKGTALFDNFVNIGPSGGDNDAYLNCSFGDGDWVAIEDSPAFSGQSVGVRCSLQIPTLPNATLRPIVEKLVGAATLSGYGLYRENNNLVFFVRGADTTLYTVTSPLVDVLDEDRWIEVHGEAEGGVLRLYRDGALAATGSYSGSIAEGTGEVLVAKFGTGSANVGVDLYDNIALFSHTVSAARIAAHVTAIPLAVEPAIAGLPTGLATFVYAMAEETGDLVMGDGSGHGHDGAWVGGPTLTVPGPLSHERGILNSGGAARFVNNVAQYGVETGLTLADPAGTVTVWYRPAALRVKAGIVEKTIGGVRGTQWGLAQFNAAVRFTRVTSGGTFTLDAPLVAEDVGRWTWLVARWQDATTGMRLYKNGVLITTGTYTGTAVSGVGDFYVGKQGTVGGVATRPAQGDIAQAFYYPSTFTTPEVAALWTQATWYNGGLCVDLALREPRQAQEWISQFALLADLRLGATATGAITATVGLVNPATIQLAARDGAGDGERNLVGITQRATPSLSDTVRDLVLRYRPDLQTGEWLRKLRREVSTRLDGQGRRIGTKKIVTLECVREDPTADRVLDRLRKRMKAAEDQVAVTLHQEARQLMEGHLVQLEDAQMGYAGEVLEVRKVGKGLETIAADLVGWDEDANAIYAPSAFPSGAEPG